MKKIILFFVVFIISMYVSVVIVYAAAGFSGEGKPTSSTGGSETGSTTSGLALYASPGIKFSLVEIHNNLEHMRVIKAGVMLNHASGHSNYFKNGSQNAAGAGAVCGWIVDNSYSTECFSASNQPIFPEGVHFSADTMSKIVPQTKGMLNFNVTELKVAIMKNSTEITSQYEKVVIHLLKQSNIIPATINSINEMDMTSRVNLNNYRVIIEPIYSMKVGDYDKYYFYTPKTIGTLVYSQNKSYGVNMEPLYENLYSTEVVGKFINPGVYSTEGTYASRLANVNHGAGYAVVKLSYDTPNTCLIENRDGNILYIDSIGGEYVDDSDGVNLEYFMNNCSCDIIANSPYKDDILNSEVKKNKFNATSCVSKTCDYEFDAFTNKYTFYGTDSSILGSYNEFASEDGNGCGCDNSKVLALKETFATEYDSICPETYPATSVSSNLKDCTVNNNTENYVIQKNDTNAINNYCSLSCNETINFNDVYGKYTVKAGQYFELEKYPSLIATKSCEVEVNYSNWYSKYEMLARKQARYATETNKYNAIKSPSTSIDVCSCPDDGGDCSYATNYTARYTSYTYENGGFSSSDKVERWGGCSHKPKPSTDSSASNKLSETIGEIERLFGNLKTCSVYLNMLDGTEKKDHETEVEEYYNFNGDLKYYYYQDYSKLGTKTNDSRPNNIDDSDMEKILRTSNQDGNYKSYISDTKHYKYFSSLNNVSTKNVGSGDYSNLITRTVKFEFDYIPKQLKTVDMFTAKISNGTTDYKNKVELKNVYDIDITAIGKDNNENYFSFTSLGDDNKIYEWFNDGKTVKINGTVKSSSSDDLKRHCTYEIKNELLYTECSGSECDAKLNVVYRIVDPGKIDPNERLDADGELGFSNWDNKKGYLVKEKIEETEKTKDTYNPNNLEYSFTLDSATIAAIREYNKGNKYDNWVGFFDCTNGNECESKFITQASDGSFNNDIAPFAKVDRNKWKYMTYDEFTHKWSIENYDKGEMTQNLFDEYKEKLGGLTP